VRPTDEATPVSAAQMRNHYKRSKWQAEQVALELARGGLPVVIVNPSAPIGPLDVEGTRNVLQASWTSGEPVWDN
jgi:dihydroflavonol-4-reductase